MSVREMMFAEAASWGRPTGGGLGEPGYQGRTADESNPPGSTPDPGAWNPCYNPETHECDDPFYSSLYFAIRQTQEPWIQRKKESAPGGLLAQAVPYAWGTDATADRQTAPTTILAGQQRIDQVMFDGALCNHYLVSLGGVTYDAYVKAGVTEPDSVTLVRVRESAPGETGPGHPPPTGVSGPTTTTATTPSDSPILPTFAPPAPDSTTQTLWTYHVADQRLIPAITSLDTGNRPLNFVLNKVLVPWRNALANVENIGLATLIGIDDALKHSAVRVEYENAQVMMPLEGAMGLTMEIVPALAYAQGWMTSLRLGAMTRGLGAAARAPAFWFMGMGGVGAGERAIPTLGRVLETSLPSETTESAFANLIDNIEFSSVKRIIDRLSRALQFDLGGYKSLTAKGKYGRVGDMLDSDEALQNAFVRHLKDIGRHDPFLADNPATALSPELHRQIGNLTSFEGLSATDVLQLHIDQMRAFTPDYVLVVLERESLKFIKLLGL